MANFCSNCGQSLENAAVNFCPNCGNTINSASSQGGPSQQFSQGGTGQFAPNPEPAFEEEITLMEGLCNRVVNPLYVQNGKGMLTNKRFIYLKHGIAKTLAIGVLVNLTEGDIDFDIPLEDIDHISDARQGLQKTIKIHTKSGDVYHFYVTKREKWKIEFENVLHKYR